MNRILLILLAVIFFSCGASTEKDPLKTPKEPSSITLLPLPGDLNEISGISFKDDSTLVAIEDETGNLYFYNIHSKKVTEKRMFAEDGDYEDVVIAGNDIYVVDSSGQLYHIANYASGTSDATVYPTSLTEENNIEGLTYDKKNNRLLLAVKDKGIDNIKDQKPVYAFSLATKKLDTKPVYSINLADIEAYYKGDALEESSKKFLKAIGNKSMNGVFRPSALAFHPLNGKLYILSSINNIIAVLDSTGKISDLLELDGKEFKQPEGLSFTSDGSLYVSNEGKGKDGNIIKVVYAK